MSDQLNKQETQELKKIQNAYYMKPTLLRINNFVEDQFVDNQSDPKIAWKNVFNQLHSIITEAYTDVKKFLDNRLEQGLIKDKKQANKTVVGNTFPYAVIYIFLHNKIIGNIPENIYITSELSKIKKFDEISVIKIEDETQKPDCDLVIYSLDKNKELDKCIIMSLKTSLRERAAQTYKWKLLMEIATSKDCSIKEKYNISYNVKNLPIICFVTINFYDEINNPQQRGMLKFFDKTFLAKNFQDDFPEFISPLSDLIEFVDAVFNKQKN